VRAKSKTIYCDGIADANSSLEAILSGEKFYFRKKNMQHEVNTPEELKSLIESEKGLLLYFYSDRCAPCISLRPKVQQMVSENFSQMKIVFVNSEKSPDIPANYGVFANPAILIFFEGQEFRRYSKYISINQLGGEIERIYNMVFDDQDTISGK